jgi:hypothetical protein
MPYQRASKIERLLSHFENRESAGLDHSVMSRMKPPPLNCLTMGRHSMSGALRTGETLLLALIRCYFTSKPRPRGHRRNDGPSILRHNTLKMTNAGTGQHPFCSHPTWHDQSKRRELGGSDTASRHAVSALPPRDKRASRELCAPRLGTSLPSGRSHAGRPWTQWAHAVYPSGPEADG